MSNVIKYMSTFLGILVVFLLAKTFYIKLKGGSNKININTEVKLMKNVHLSAKIITDKGEININLFPEAAPFTVLNFVHLSKIGYYDNLKFHRVIPDFMIQGGDPEGTGAGGPGYQFGDEFKEGIVFDKPGLLAMANAGKNTNGSQFFITHVETPWLNYKHTIFGEVVSEEDQKIVNLVKQGDIIKTIEIIGNTDSLYTDDVKETVEQINSALKERFPNLKY